MRRLMQWLVSVLVALPGAALAEAPSAEWFATAATPFRISLAPDGQHLARLVSDGGKGKLLVVAVAEAARERVAPLEVEDGDIVRCRWLTGTRLLLTVQRGGQRVTQVGAHTDTGTRLERPRRLVAIDIDGGNPRDLEAGGSEGGMAATQGDLVVALAAGSPDHILMMAQKDRYAEPAVVRMDARTGVYTMIQEPVDGVVGWIADSTGRLRAGLRHRDRGYQVLALRDDGRLTELTDSRIEDLQVLGMGNSPDTLMVRGRDDRGYLGLYELPLAGGDLRPVVAEPGADIGAPILRDRKVIGVEIAGDRPKIIMIEPAMKALQQRLEAQWPGEAVSVTDLSDDGRLAIVSRRAAAQPDQPMLVKVDTGEAVSLGRNLTPALRADLGSRESVTFPSRDGLTLTGILSLPTPRPASRLPFIVLPHQEVDDRADLKFHWLAQFLSSRGYAVLQPNSRGSTGRGLDFERAGNGQWGRAIQDDIADATRWAIDQGIADPARLCIVGMGFGGYSAMVAAFRDTQLYQCAVSINGFTNLASLFDRSHYYILGQSARDRIGHNRDALAAVSPLRQVDRMTTPLLMIQGGADQSVPVEDSRGFAQAMVKANKELIYVGLPHADHFLSRPQDRVQILNKLSAFLTAMIPPAGQ